MATERTKFQNLSVEAEDAFGVINAAPAWLQLAAWDVSSEINRERLEDMTARVDRGENPPVVGTKSKTGLSFKTYATGLGTAGSGAVSQTSLGAVLVNAIGTQDLDTGSTFKAGDVGTVSAPKATTAANFSADNIAGFVLADYGTVWRHIESIAGDELSVSYDLPAVGASLAAIYACANYRLSQDLSGNSLQFREITERSDLGIDYYGVGVDSVKLARVAPTQNAVLEFSCKAATWDDSITSGSASLVAPTLPPKAPWMDSVCEIIPFGTTAYSAAYRRRVRGLSFSIANGLSPDPDPHSTQGVAGWMTGDKSLADLEITFGADDAWRDSYAAGDFYTLMLTIGRTAGRVFGMFARKLVILDEPKQGDDGGNMTVTVRFGTVTGAATPQIVVFQG